MKTLKIVAVLTLVALAATLLIASAYAYTGGRIGTSDTTNSPNGATSYGSYTGGIMGRGSMMGGYGYSGAVGTTPHQSSTPSANTSNIFKPMYNWMIGFCRGMMSRIR
jgi:uncharacterized membrane protein